MSGTLASEQRRASSWRADRLALSGLAGLAAVAVLAWGDVLFGIVQVGRGGEAVAFLAGWLTMMTAMMLPSAAPFVLLLGRTAPDGRAGRAMAMAASGYLAIWTLAGLPALAAESAMHVPAAVVAATLVIAGAYQLSPLKERCLTRCRSPLGFVLERWRSGRCAAMRLGWSHGVYCLGCCWALMAVLVVAGAMGLAWVAVIAVVVAIEKLAPRGPAIGRALGVALVAVGVAITLDPDLLDTLRSTGMEAHP